MLRAHRQAWAWQDEWHGLTMEDIREIERQTQLALRRKMGQTEEEIGKFKSILIIVCFRKTLLIYTQYIECGPELHVQHSITGF